LVFIDLQLAIDLPLPVSYNLPMAGLKYLIFLSLIPLFIICPVNALTLLGFEIPTPINISGDTSAVFYNSGYDGIGSDFWLKPGDNLPYAGFAVKAEIILYLSFQGDVDSLKLVGSESEAFINGIRNSLVQIKFTPASYRGAQISCRLPAEIFFTVKDRRAYAVLRLPFLAFNGYRNRRLIDKALLLNGFELPGIRRFPSYYCSAKSSDKIENYNSAIFQTSLDSSGKPVQVFEYCSTNIDYSKLFALAILHGEFQPALYRGLAESSDIYITVRFFPQIDYPTHDWPPADTQATAFPLEFVRMETSLYLDSIIHPAFPLNFPGGIINWSDYIPFSDSVYSKVEIDTLGRIIKQSFYTPVWGDMKTLVEQVFHTLRFIPARDINNARLNFSGSIILRFQNGRNIRIEAEWLPPEAQPECRITD